MITSLLIALAAGCASALMFASVISGALISPLLFYLAPLPLMVVALGWGAAGATIGGIAAGAGLGAIFGIPHLLIFVLTVAAPAAWLGHLALLGRPVSAVSSDNCAAASMPRMEWYPVGRILIWIAGFGVLTSLAFLGPDSAAIRASVRALLSVLGPGTSAVDADIEQVIDVLVKIAPAAAAMVAITTLTLNLWLAAKITATSDRLLRPWPDLKATALPPLTLAALSLALALSFTGGWFGTVALIVSAALLMAYALVGFAVLHTLTLGIKYRARLLGCVYALVVVSVYPVLAVAGLGLADAIFGLRQRYLRSRPPPAPLA
jgi:hypothetical protein